MNKVKKEWGRSGSAMWVTFSLENSDHPSHVLRHTFVVHERYYATGGVRVPTRWSRPDPPEARRRTA